MTLNSVALTIATPPTFTGFGRLSHASITSRRSSGRSDTHMTHFSCKNVPFWCSDVCGSCSGEEKAGPTGVGFCGTCPLPTFSLCSEGFMPKKGFEHPTLYQRSQHPRHMGSTSPIYFNALSVESENLLTPESHRLENDTEKSV